MNGRVSLPWWVTCAMNVQRGSPVIALAGGSPPHSRAIKPAACAFSAVVIRWLRLVVSAFRVSLVSRSGFWLSSVPRMPYFAVCSSSAARFPSGCTVVGLDLVEEDVERAALLGRHASAALRAVQQVVDEEVRDELVLRAAGSGQASTIRRSSIARAMS